ncbi:MAG: GNAT family protein [Alphaproteobacteria bacterium]
MARINEFGQLIGDAVPGWTPRPYPPATPMQGRFGRLEPLSATSHAASLYQAFSRAPDGRLWTYVPSEPPQSLGDMAQALETRTSAGDLVMNAILDRSGSALGYAAFMRIDPKVGGVEVGHVVFSPALQRSPLATEAMYLMMRRAFDELGYRRYEWKCDSLNAPSRRAAERLGFRYEGTFRNAMVLKGRNRDTAWFSIIESEWPVVKAALEAWLDPANFDSTGQQRRRLEEIRAALGQ